jgi:hypothetical protein
MIYKSSFPEINTEHSIFYNKYYQVKKGNYNYEKQTYY